MVGSSQGSLTHSPESATENHALQRDLLVIVRAAIEGASAGRAVTRALADPRYQDIVRRPIHVIAAGKAAASMTAALVTDTRLNLQTVFAVGTHRSCELPDVVEWREADHPLPDTRSVEAGMRARDISVAVSPDAALIVLLSGGASALLALPATNLTLDDKRRTIDRMMRAGADIHALNTVRKHLSAIKGGQLARDCAGVALTLAVSDVMDDDVSVIGSGPGVPDETTWADAAAAITRWGGSAHPVAVRERIAAGVAGKLADTPKAGEPSLVRAQGCVIASRHDALDAAERAAEHLGYRVIVLAEAVTGEARIAADQWYSSVTRDVAAGGERLCVLSAGETTVRVIGLGKGGRNQEFALALASRMHESTCDALVASVGTDGIDGPTDAAGAFVDCTTLRRAAQLGLFPPAVYQDQNNAFEFFDRLGDLIRIGPTDTNVGDLQIFLAAGR